MNTNIKKKSEQNHTFLYFDISKYRSWGSARSGFSVAELLISVAVLALLLALVVGAFSLFNRNGALERSADIILSALEESRNLTLFSKDGNAYGVHFEEDEIVIFAGGTYSAEASGNIVFGLNKAIAVTNVSLEGGGEEVLFKKLYGETETYGSVTISQKTDPSKEITIIISRSGGSKTE